MFVLAFGFSANAARKKKEGGERDQLRGRGKGQKGKMFRLATRLVGCSITIVREESLKKKGKGKRGPIKRKGGGVKEREARLFAEKFISYFDAARPEYVKKRGRKKEGGDAIGGGGWREEFDRRRLIFFLRREREGENLSGRGRGWRGESR